MRAAAAQLQAGHLEQAATLFERIVKAKPKFLPALAALGRIHGEMGNRELAIDYMQQAIALDDRQAILHLTLAYLLHETGHLEASIEAAEKAASLDPSIPAVHRALAIIYEHGSRLDDAAKAAERTLEVDANDAGAKTVLARVHRRRGDLEQARKCADEVAGQFTPETIPPYAAHELGMVLDKQKEYEGAYDAFVQAGRAHQRSRQGRRMNPQMEIDYIEAMKAGVKPELFGRWSRDDFGDDLPAPRFLVGFPRSGTTMTEQIMAAHPRLVTLEEKSITRQAMGLLHRRGDTRSMPEVLAEMDLDAARKLRARYWELARSYLDDSADDRIVLDKHPLNIVQLACVSAIFPEAKVLVALRDPRDCCLSCFFQDFSLNPAMANFLSLDQTTKFYDHVMGLWLHLRGMLTLDWLEFRYEDTVDDLEGQARKLLEFLGLDWDPRVLQFQEFAKKRAIATPSYEAVTQKVTRRAVGRWRNYERHFEPFLGRLEPYVQAFGYAAEG